jgi:dihydrofolate synthase/folylpolyglutamate synthase
LPEVTAKRTLAQWLAWMESNHPRQIELGLERIRTVAARLQLTAPRATVVTVAGTNGKGSCVAFLEAILRAGGHRVGCYTSPHLLRYNERVRIDGLPVADADLCAAFEAVHAALDDVSLTYFEYGTLAALWLFARVPLDVLVLEVGLGGRLDAVNLIDADVAVVTSIDLDHQDWLGNDRELIGREKAGIFRAGQPAICADPEPPQSLAAHAATVGARWLPVGAAFSFATSAQGWSWRSDALAGAPAYRDLPLPQLPLPSAAAALAVLHCLPLAIGEAAIRAGLRAATLPGRFQRLVRGGVEILLDVAHNPHAARYLAQRLAQSPARPTRAVMAVMADKDVAGIVQPLQALVEHWLVGDLPGNDRALPAAVLAAQLQAAGCGAVERFATVDTALVAALEQLPPGSRLLVFGSFFTVAAALTLLDSEGEGNGR